MVALDEGTNTRGSMAGEMPIPVSVTQDQMAVHASISSTCVSVGRVRWRSEGEVRVICANSWDRQDPAGREGPHHLEAVVMRGDQRLEILSGLDGHPREVLPPSAAIPALLMRETSSSPPTSCDMRAPGASSSQPGGRHQAHRPAAPAGHSARR
jgi:hypothetical protein